jgi:hypothetical protein
LTLINVAYSLSTLQNDFVTGTGGRFVGVEKQDLVAACRGFDSSALQHLSEEYKYCSPVQRHSSAKLPHELFNCR